jgi:hypothetical protein
MLHKSPSSSVRRCGSYVAGSARGHLEAQRTSAFQWSTDCNDRITVKTCELSSTEHLAISEAVATATEGTEGTEADGGKRSSAKDGATHSAEYSGARSTYASRSHESSRGALAGGVRPRGRPRGFQTADRPRFLDNSDDEPLSRLADLVYDQHDSVMVKLSGHTMRAMSPDDAHLARSFMKHQGKILDTGRLIAYINWLFP